MQDSKWCVMHDPRYDPVELGRKGGVIPPVKKLPPTNLPRVEVDTEEDFVIPVLQRAVEQMEQMQVTPRDNVGLDGYCECFR